MLKHSATYTGVPFGLPRATLPITSFPRTTSLCNRTCMHGALRRSGGECILRQYEHSTRGACYHNACSATGVLNRTSLSTDDVNMTSGEAGLQTTPVAASLCADSVNRGAELAPARVSKHMTCPSSLDTCSPLNYCSLVLCCVHMFRVHTVNKGTASIDNRPRW
jgi:hypothetical protein